MLHLPDFCKNHQTAEQEFFLLRAPMLFLQITLKFYAAKNSFYPGKSSGVTVTIMALFAFLESRA